MSVARERLLLRTLVELADTLVTDYEVVDFLYLLCDRAVEILGADVADLREDTARWPAFAEQATDRGSAACTPDRYAYATSTSGRWTSSTGARGRSARMTPPLPAPWPT